MKKRLYQPATYRVLIGTDYGPLQMKENLSKALLRHLVEQWFKDERAQTLVIEVTRG